MVVALSLHLPTEKQILSINSSPYQWLYLCNGSSDTTPYSIPVNTPYVLIRLLFFSRK